ncbi:MAG: 2TM domain-containing protein [Bacteroidota bacterium]
MHEELYKKAKKKVEAKVSFYTCCIVFFFVTIVLLMLGSYLPEISFWLKLPIPIFIMVLTILYLTAFGLPTSSTLSEDWQEREIEKEMKKLYQQQKTQLPPLEELSETESLELKELERLREKKENWEDDFV